MSFVAPLVFSCWGTRRSSMMFPCVFAASHKARALFFSAESLLGTFQVGFSLFFGVLDQLFGLREACFARFLHRGSARARICASWRRQTTNSEANGVTKSIFVPPRGSLFGPLFGTFSYFSEFCDFVKIELPCGRELDFEGPGRSKCYFFSLVTPSKNRSEFGGSFLGGDPPGNLERTRGPTSCGQNAYRDSHRLWPKSTTPRRCLGTKLGTVAKEPWSSSKAQNIKEGINNIFKARATKVGHVGARSSLAAQGHIS